MSSEFAARVPTLWHGHDIARQTTTRLTADRETLVVADSSVATCVVADYSGRTIEVDAHSMTVTAVVGMAEEIARRPPSVIVAVGGGSVLDATKIASLVLAPGGMFDFAIERASKSALTFLPDARPPVDIVAVPTTIGTSSETNSVSILKNKSGYRLIVGRSLRPRHAIIDPCNLRTLTSASVREGALEAFLRLAGASTGSRRSARGRRDAIALGGALLETASGDVAAADSRLRLARLSGATQRSAALRGHDPYSARHWYVANEVAFVLQVRKMVATAAIIAAVWRRVCSGDPRWGDRASLEEFWTNVAGRVALPLDPPTGIAALVDRWGIPRPRRPPAQTIRRISDATETAWGNRYPMLAGLFADDFCDLLRDSYWNEGR
ncbi:daptide-type RiPP biosynthesis dehydogenase [Microbacterium sp. K2]|uniref:daptide-type RiPP biosynthesis dehydogenase n=1 Tax=Microbacterium sp. K2 TaxID=3391827 RepID=UPI003EDAFA8A